MYGHLHEEPENGHCLQIALNFYFGFTSHVQLGLLISCWPITFVKAHQPDSIQGPACNNWHDL